MPFWRETDLDTMNIIDHNESWDTSYGYPMVPLYINADLRQNTDGDIGNPGMKSSDSMSEENVLNSIYMPHEKPEIKTVRIVKRESERRQRDREKTTTGKWEDDLSPQNLILMKLPVQQVQNGALTVQENYESEEYEAIKQSASSVIVSAESLSDPKICDKNNIDKSPRLSTLFKSEAAKQIITEVSSQEILKQVNRRTIPREKRRHYTAPHNNLIMKSLNELSFEDSAFHKINNRRARDDLDMERALRQRIDAPDVVRSTLSSKELKYNENTIDNILGTPSKINIPERYIPEQLPQLTAEEQEHRLRKVESIKKMLSDTIIASSSTNLVSGLYENTVKFQNH